MGLLTHFSQEEPFDLSQKPTGLRLSQSDGESVPGSSCQEEDEESLYRRSQYSPEPAGEDQYIQELEERRRGSPAELRPQENQKNNDTEKQVHPPYDPRRQMESTAERSDMTYESDLELNEQVYQDEAPRRRSRDYDSDSELEEQVHQQKIDKPNRNKQWADRSPGSAERNQNTEEKSEMANHLHKCEFMEITGSEKEEGDKE